MTIELTPDQERILQNALRQGRFRSVEEAVERAIQSIAQEQPSTETLAPRESLSQFFRNSPLAGSGINLDRDKDSGLTLEL